MVLIQNIVEPKILDLLKSGMHGLSISMRPIQQYYSRMIKYNTF